MIKNVDKVWGREEWIVNREYCGKLLYLNKGHQCSLHYHNNKDETFYVLEGKVLMEYNKDKKTMVKGETIHIPQKMKHRFFGLEDSIIIEFSTHHKDNDSHRLEKSK